MDEETLVRVQEEIRRIQNTSMSRAARRKEINRVAQKLAGEGKDPKPFVEMLDRGTKEKKPPTNRAVKDVLESIPTTRTGRKLVAKDIVNAPINVDEGIVFQNKNFNFTGNLKERFTEYAETLDNTDIVMANYSLLENRYNKQMRSDNRAKRLKTIKVDINKYIGANALSKGAVREGIYDHWESASKKFGAFKKALDDLIGESIKLVNGSPEGQKFIRKMNQIQSDITDMNLEYIYDFGKLTTRYQENPVHRLLDALIRIENAENLNAYEAKTSEAYEEDIDTSTDVSWQENYMATQTAQSAPSAGELNPAVGEEDDENVARLNQMAERVQGEIDTDPLLAYEVMKGTKLLALEKEAEEVLRESIETIRQGKGYIDFQTYMDNLLEELDDSIVLDRDSYCLPISLVSDKIFFDLVKGKKIETGFDGEGEPVKQELIKMTTDDLDELFDNLHEAFTDKKFGFENAVRTTTSRARTMVTTQRDAGQGSKRREPRIETIIGESQRMRPINPVTRGRMKAITARLEDEFTAFFKAFNDYYVNPLYQGKTPVTMPSFTTGAGYRALTVFAKDMGVNTVLGSAMETLAREGRTMIKADVLLRLNDFLETLAKPKINVNVELIRKASAASEALSEIFGNDEDNYNYFSAVVVHYAELTGDFDDVNSERIGRKSIRERAKQFEEDYAGDKAFTIFALPQYLEQHQSILTRKDSIKKEYRKLVALLNEIEDDIPVILKRLIEAHDAIRKQLGKEVSYGFMPMTFDSYDMVISKMEKEENIDLSHLEVENIVKAVDSHNNISKEFGITEDQVYLIKSSFR